jgi:hypothetical protein
VRRFLERDTVSYLAEPPSTKEISFFSSPPPL